MMHGGGGSGGWGAGRGIGRTDWGEAAPKRISGVTLRRMLASFWPHRGLMAAVVLCVLVVAGLGLLPPLLTKALIDDALANRDRGRLLWLVGGLILSPLVAGFVGVAQGWLSNTLVQRVMVDLRDRLFTHLLDLPLAFYTRTRSGDIISRVTNDVNGIQNVLSNNFTNAISNIFTVASTVALMMYLDWSLTLVALAAIPLFVIPTLKVARVRLQAGRRLQQAISELTATLSEKLNIGGLILVKTFARQPQERALFRVQSQTVMRRQIEQQMVGRWYQMFTALVAAVIPALVLGYGGWHVINGTLTVGAIVAFVALATRLFIPIAQLLNLQLDIAGSVALFERIFEYLDLPREIEEKSNAYSPERIEGEVRFEDVELAYVPYRPVLQKLSFSAKPGEKIAIVGPSGAGKTSIGYLLLRLYDPTDGRVTIDGRDLRDWGIPAIGRHVGVVTQETNLFHTTLAANLRYAKDGATDDDLIAACKSAYIHDVIAAMPNGYQTIVGERGYRLSGGEKQRVAVARLLLKDPRIIILDEATSSLDTHSERLIQAAMEELMKGRTSFIIAHRLSTVLNADRILVLDGGRLVEQGTHAELLARGGLYATLHREQFRAEATPAS